MPPEIAQKYMAIPYSQVNSTLHVAMADPTDFNAIDDIKFMTGLSRRSEHRHGIPNSERPWTPSTTPACRSDDVLDDFEDDDLGGRDVGHLGSGRQDAAKMAEEAPVVKLVNYVLARGDSEEGQRHSH